MPGLILTSLAGLIIVLPVLAVIVAVMPHVVALVVALFRNDTPFVSHRAEVLARGTAIACVVASVLAFVAIQPRYFRPGSAEGAAKAEIGDPVLRAVIAPYVKSVIDSLPGTGLVVGVVQPTGNQVFGFGQRSVTSLAAPNGETVFEIGGMTQVFTASLLARMVEKHVVQMDQDLQSLLPDSVSVPMKEGQPVELQHLATGSSGLPRLAPSPAAPVLEMLPPFSRAAPPRTAKWLYDQLSSIDLPYAPGTHVDGSDLGMGLLGHALERASKTKYETLLEREICGPLGLRDTRVTLTPAMRSRLATGMRMGWGSYRGWRVASPSHRWPQRVLPGATDLCSTANDLLTLVRAHLAGFPLATTLAETRRSRLQIQGRPDIGLGWFIESTNGGESIVWQHGAAGPCRSYVAFLQGHAVGVVVLANGPIDVDLLGKRVLNRLLSPGV
jgi:CubicO group peptidase (beta-lactamase class C family)